MMLFLVLLLGSKGFKEMTWAGASLRPKKTQTYSPGTREGSVFPKMPGPRPVPSTLRSGPLRGGLRRLPRRLGTPRGAGAARKGGKNEEEEGTGLPLTAPCQGHRRGGAASFPRVALSAPGAGGAPAGAPSQPRAAPGVEQADGREGTARASRALREGGGTAERTPNLPGPPPTALARRPDARPAPGCPPPAAPAPLGSRRESGPGGRGEVGRRMRGGGPLDVTGRRCRGRKWAGESL